MKKSAAKPAHYIMDQDLLQDGSAQPEAAQDASASAALLLGNILQGLDASLKTLALPSAQGTVISAAHLAKLCKESGLSPEVAEKVMAGFLAHAEGAPMRAKNQLNAKVKVCPALNARSGNGICTGKDCGLDCISIPL